MRLRTLTLCGAVLLVAGCSTTTQGAPTVSSTEPAPLFNPCDIPDDALRAAGVDPGTEESGVGGVEFPGWQLCRWQATAGWYFLTVYSTDHTLEEMRKNTALTDFQAAKAGTRTGETNMDKAGNGDSCNFAFSVDQGLIMVGVVAKYLVPRPEEPCTTVLLRTSDLDEQLPV